MMDEFGKCSFCKYWDNYDGNTNCWCGDNDGFKIDIQKIYDKAHILGIGVADVLQAIGFEVTNNA